MVALAPIVTVATLSFRSSLRGLRVLALAGLASIPTLVLLALVAARADATTLRDAAQLLFVDLTLPVVVIVVTLVLSVAQLRTEIDDDTLAYLTSRSIPRGGLVLGKYLGSAAASAVLLVPAALGPLLVAAAGGGAPFPDGAVAAIVAMTLLGTLAYGALFLLLGLVMPSALLVGILFGFLWEKLLLLLPGSVPKLTISYYLHALASDTVTSGPLSVFSTELPTALGVLAPLLAAIVFVVMAMATIRYVELVPRRTSV